MTWDGPLDKTGEFTYEIPTSYKQGMNVPGRIYANDAMLDQILEDNAMEQVANVATLPGIVEASMAMPDIHWGYGFPIGGVAAFDMEEGVISPGGVGFDINCGVRLLSTDLTAHEVAPELDRLTDVLFDNCPSGVGTASRVKFSHSQLDQVLEHGVPWLIEHGFGWERDAEHIEHGGVHPEADPDKASQKSKDRGKKQIGSLGGGNHFLEVQRVEAIIDEPAAKAYGIEEEGQVCVMIHTGSRGYGHQICTDFLKTMERSDRGFTDQLVDKQLACAPIDSQPAQDYYGAMCSAINYAFCNRQVHTHQVRKSFEKVFGRDAEDMGIEIVYDVAHNIAKKETHEVDGERRELMIHRKGATRAHGPGQPDVPADYGSVGQPVIIPGDMGNCSYLLSGTEGAMEQTFGSTCHGAGRQMSRTQAKKTWRGEDLVRDLRSQKNIIVKAASNRVAAEEAPGAYKDVSNVVDVCQGAGISNKVVKLAPMGVIKG